MVRVCPGAGAKEGDSRVTPAKGALEVTVRGVVQGVGFRPFVHRLALRLGLTGWVRNEAGAVRILAEGGRDSLDRFRSDLRREAPPLARIDRLDFQERTIRRLKGFRIVPSELGEMGRLPLSPDVAVCPACLAEFNDPHDRRFHYPFITCTDCGPRFTVIDGMPYDRERTSMAAFSQCEDCSAEYRNPESRRYHSETNSCPVCGPHIWFEDKAAESTLSFGAPGLEAAAALLRGGGILALRGLGGFHLAVDATNEAAVSLLRTRKGREEKPLAVMVGDLDEARRVGAPTSDEEVMLSSPERPIVLLEEGGRSALAPSVAPGLGRIGVMLPYSPLHYLLLESVGRPLVMTSGNRSEEPIVAGNRESRIRLGSLADGFLLHDREIVTPCDDSVVQVFGGATVFHRRARGFAPLPLSLPFPSPRPILAVGPHLKNTFALAQEDSVFLSQHIGDLDNLETLAHFRETLGRFKRLFRIEPDVVVRDMHPGYLSTRVAHEVAEALGSAEVMAVQHHHAHVAAVLAEYGEAGPAVGLAFDGTGYGEDGCVWGAEVLVAGLTTYRRAGHLRYSPLPGGEAAIRNPWRTVLGYLSLVPAGTREMDFAFLGVPDADRGVVARLIEGNLNAPLASSMGRLFDAAAAVLGLRNRCAYEGQAAMELEASAVDRVSQTTCFGGNGGATPSQELPFPTEKDAGGVHVMDPIPLLLALGEARQRGAPLEELALAFHYAVAHASAGVAASVCAEEGITKVVLCGGVFQNSLLARLTRRLLEESGLRVLFPRILSPNDGAISYGQAAVAAARLRAESERGEFLSAWAEKGVPTTLETAERREGPSCA